MIELITLWNKIETKPNIPISVELEKLSPRLIILVEYADVVFLSRDYALQMGWNNREEAVDNLRKEVKKRFVAVDFSIYFQIKTLFFFK